MQQQKIIERTIQGALNLVLGDFSGVHQSEPSRETLALPQERWFSRFTLFIGQGSRDAERWEIQELNEYTDSYYVRLTYRNGTGTETTYYKCSEQLPFYKNRASTKWSGTIEKDIPIPQIGDLSNAGKNLYLYPKLYRGKPFVKSGNLFDTLEHGDSVLVEGTREANKFYISGRNKGFRTVRRSQGNGFYRIWFLTRV